MNENETKFVVNARRGRPPKHGGYSLISRGKIAERRKYIEEYLRSAREGLIRDLGPTERDLTTAQLLLIDRIITKLGVVRLIEEHVNENGVFHNGRLSSSLNESYIAYDNSIRLSLQALGITGKRSHEILDLGRYVAERNRAEPKSGQTSEVDRMGVTKEDK